MNGDFSRDTFDPLMHFSRVLMQQGRVHVDADWNEQVSILLHHARTLAADLIGPFGGLDDGFEIKPFTDAGGVVTDLMIGPGHYYVDGFLCESPSDSTYSAQDGNPDEPLSLPGLVYLDVWERHLTFLEQPSIREVALDGPDTASRARVIGQVRIESTPPEGKSFDDVKKNWSEWKNKWQWENRGLLRARAQTGQPSTDVCIEPPESQYRGPENQLYRVEIHHGGLGSSDQGMGREATFKWSRENASVVFGIQSLTIDDADSLTTVTLEEFGRDARLGLQVGDWVEILDEDSVLRGDLGSLLQVREVDRSSRLLVLEGVATVIPDPQADPDEWKNPLLRRWDHREEGNEPLEAGAVPIREGMWLDLEDGVQIMFDADGDYRSADFWLIPARVATGDVEWPRDATGAMPLPPRGIDHHYAPLAVITADGIATDLRTKIQPVST